MRKSMAAVAIFLAVFAAPLFAEIQISGELTLIGRARAGEEYEGIIRMRNTGEAPEDVKIYQSDYMFYADGSSVYDEPGTHARSNADWIRFSPNFLTIPAGAGAEIGYQVVVPDTDMATGTYWSLLLIEGIPEESSVEGTEGKFTLAIQQVVRYGIQIVTEIGNDAVSRVSFENPVISREDDKRTLIVDVVNSGQVWLRPEFSCTVFDLLGENLGVIVFGRSRLYPDTSVRLTFELPDLETGSYKALVIADAGGDNLFGANYTLKLDE